MFEPLGLVTFLSDFGLRDSYVAEVKGAMLRLDKGLRVVDISHEVPRQDVREGAFVLSRAVVAFPRGTVHLAVVDPGVGTGRRAVVVEAGGHCLVGPDNGLLSWAVEALGKGTWYAIRHAPKTTSLTFHGRDVFGPIAAAIAAARLRPVEVGEALDAPVVIPFPAARFGPDEVTTEVVRVDGYGNLILAVRAADLGQALLGQALDVVVGDDVFEARVGTYAEGASLVVHEDSSGLVEVAVPFGSAAARLLASRGTEVRLRWR